MKMPNYRGLMEVARETAIPYYRIIYAENAGWLPAPMRLANKRIYTDADVDRIRAHFSSKENDEKNDDAVRQTPRCTSG